MDRAASVNQIWNWLPAFRVVAETQHLPTASKEAHLSASALSRAVKLVEEQLGRQLFERDGRQIILSPAGRVLLSAVRDAMRRVEEATEAIAETTMSGSLRISASGPYASIFVLPALQKLMADYPSVRPLVDSVAPPEVTGQLLNGKLDLALVDDPEPHEDLDIVLLGRLKSSVYAGVAHPLFGREDVTLREILGYPFVGPPAGLTDHFPAEHRREVIMQVSQLHIGVQACAAGRVLAFLPEFIADAYHGEGKLHRLPLSITRARPLHAVHRRLVNHHSGGRQHGQQPSPIVVVREAIESAIRGASQYSRPGSVQPPESIRNDE